MTDTLPWWVALAVSGLRARQHARSAAPPAAARSGRLEAVAGGVLVLLSVAVNAPGALSRQAMSWNYLPEDVDLRPSRLWDWSDPQFLAWMGERDAAPEDEPR
jgi:hypothetical protein